MSIRHGLPFAFALTVVFTLAACDRKGTTQTPGKLDTGVRTPTLTARDAGLAAPVRNDAAPSSAPASMPVRDGGSASMPTRDGGIPNPGSTP